MSSRSVSGRRRSGGTSSAHSLAEWAIGRSIDLPDLDVHRPTLEDTYLALTDDRKDDR